MANLQADFGLAPDTDAAEFLGKTRRTLANDRCQGRGPPFVKLAFKIYYPLKALREHIARNTVTPVGRKTLIDSSARRRRSVMRAPQKKKPEAGYDSAPGQISNSPRQEAF